VIGVRKLLQLAATAATTLAPACHQFLVVNIQPQEKKGLSHNK